jgi:trans-aconitate 2-methyltransferase
MDWNPEAYKRFNEQRSRPLVDLLELLPPLRDVRLLDLGCGDGRLTRFAAERLGAAEVLGIDSSDKMIAAARAADDRGARSVWHKADLRDVLDEEETYDVVLSNAALQFVPDHLDVFPRLMARVAPGGWLAVHMPYNHIARSHLLMEMAARADDLAGSWTGPAVSWPQERPETYARMLKDGRFEHGLVQLRTYRHTMPGAAAIVEWMRSGGLGAWLDVIEPSRHEAFVGIYQELISQAYPPLPDDQRLLDYTRLLIVARAPG